MPRSATMAAPDGGALTGGMLRSDGPLWQRFVNDDRKYTALHQYLLDRQRHAWAARRPRESLWRDAEAQLNGDFFVRWDTHRHDYVPIPLSPHRVRAVREIQAPALAVYAAQMQDITGRVTILPVTDTGLQQLTAARAQKVVSAVVEGMDPLHTINQAVRWSFIGCGAFYCGYDPDEGEYTEVPATDAGGNLVRYGDSGQPQMAYAGPEGFPFIEAESPLNVLFGPGYRPGQPRRDAFHAITLTRDSFVRTYGEFRLRLARKIAGEGASTDFGAPVWAEGASADDLADDSYRVYTYWQRAEPENDYRGCKIDFTEERILRIGPNPYSHGRVPLLPFWYLPDASGYGRGPGAMLVPVQRQTNELERNLIEAVRNGVHPALLVPANAQLDTDRLMNREQYAVYKIAHQGARPFHLEQPPFPFEAQRLLDEYHEYAGRIAHASAEAQGLQRGKAPSSGRAQFAQKESLAAALAFPKASIQAAYAQAVMQVLHCMRQFAFEGRRLPVLGDDGGYEVITYDAETLPERFSVKVLAADMFGGSKLAAFEIGAQLWAMGVVKDSLGQPDESKLFTLLGADEYGPLLSPYKEAQTLALDENERLLRGEACPTFEADLHSVHILQHRRLLADQRVRQTPQLAQAVEEHIRGHEAAAKGQQTRLLAAQFGAQAVAAALAQAEALSVQAQTAPPPQPAAPGPAGMPPPMSMPQPAAAAAPMM